MAPPRSAQEDQAKRLQGRSVRGWSWGELELTDKASLRLMSDEKVALEIDLAEVNQVACVGKQELNLELNAKEDEVLQGIRFFVPAGASSEGDGMSAEKWRDELLRLAKTTEGQLLAQVQEVQIVAPRGKHDMSFYPKSLQMRGKTQTYTVKWSSMKRIFVLDLANDKLVVFGLTQPIRNGKMMYQLIGLRFSADASTETEETVPQAAWDAMRTDASFGKSRANALAVGQADESGEVPTWSLVAGLLRELSGQKLLEPSPDFQTDEQKSVPCTFMTDRGHLFFFAKQLLFVTKPIVWKLYSDIQGIDFRESPMRKSSFDLRLQMVDGKPMEFSQIEKQCEKDIFQFFQKIPELKDKIHDASAVQRRLEEGPRPAKTDQSTFAKSGRRVKKTAPVDYDEEDDDDDFETSQKGDDDEDEEDDDEDDVQPARKKLRSSRK